MDNETIRKAADESCHKNAIFDPDNAACYRQGFRDGAEWRINEVWHDMEEEVPKVYGEYEDKVAPSIPCLVRGYLSTGYGYGIRYWNVDYEVWDDEQADDYECDKNNIECWAYLDDLLPSGKEENNEEDNV